jgi:hypothetical protein
MLGSFAEVYGSAAEIAGPFVSRRILVIHSLFLWVFLRKYWTLRLPQKYLAISWKLFLFCIREKKLQFTVSFIMALDVIGLFCSSIGLFCSSIGLLGGNCGRFCVGEEVSEFTASWWLF